MNREKSVRLTQRHNRTALFGALLIVFAIVGVIAAGASLFRLGTGLFSNAAEKERFEKLVLPLVVLDPPPFDSLGKAEQSTLIQAAIWNTLFNEDRVKYEDTAAGVLVIPATDVEAYARKLFGPDVALQHQTVGDIELSYQYDAETQAYIVPLMGRIQRYTPKVAEYEQRGDIYYVKVGYIPPGSVWNGGVDGEDNAAEPDKYMQYLVEKQKDGNLSVIAVIDVPQQVTGE